MDHGKSTLIQALTGTHPDRLKEEQEREMTIDLGFAWWELPDGEEVGVVDVPGHRDFIENMLAGIGGIDAVLFVVAADEGVMPQTREHLAILDILQIQAGVVVLTKIDMVEDESWLDLVEEELRQKLDGTVLGNAEIVRVSAKEGLGLEELQTALSGALSQQPDRPDLGRPRLPIDRVFTMAGFGTVVTGTLVDGVLRVGEDVVVLPGGLKGRVRGLQTHKRKEEDAQPGTRTAVNISGLSVEDVQRGQVVVHPGTINETRRVDVSFRLLDDVSLPLKHDNEVKLFVGAAEVLARVRLLGVEVLNPGEEGWLQLELREPVVAERGDRYILRRPSPGETMGGGVVLDPHPERRHKRFSDKVVERLEALSKGSPEEVLLHAILSVGVGEVNQASKKVGFGGEDFQRVLDDLVKSDQVVLLGKKNELVAGKLFWTGLSEKTLDLVQKYHDATPLRKGIPRQELSSRLKVTGNVFEALVDDLVSTEKINREGPIIHKQGFEIVFSPEQQKKRAALLAKFADAPFSPPTIKVCHEEVGEDVYQAMVDLGELLPLSSEVVFRPDDYQDAVEDVRGKIQADGPVTLGEMRDQWGTTRRYVQALLEYMDTQGITVRDGDRRKLK